MAGRWWKHVLIYVIVGIQGKETGDHGGIVRQKDTGYVYPRLGSRLY